jgi:dihydropyrimidinase/dihydroorotase/allantoinase
MSDLELAFVNGVVLDERGQRRADIGVAGGVIAAIASPGELGSADRVVDATGKWLMPGFVDVHFHCRAPDHPEREDFASGTMAAAAGGVTTVLEMPVADVGVSTVERLVARRRLAEADAFVDFGLFAGCGSLSPNEITGLAEAGAVGFKVFTHTPHPDRRSAFDGLWLTENSDLLRALELVRGTGLLCAFHSEDESLLRWFADPDGPSDSPGRRYSASRPPVVEAMAVARLGILAEATGARVHIVHVTSRWALDVIRAAQARGVALTAETCPHYMFFTDQVLIEDGVWAKVAPPLRAPDDAAALIEGVADGSLQAICSDHAPFAEADRTNVDIMEAPSGLPSVEVYAHLAMDAALRGLIDLNLVVRALTAGPARLYGLYPRKGSLQAGSDADVIVYDSNAETTVRIADWKSRSRSSARLFEGLTYRGRVEQTFVRGCLTYDRGTIVGKQGWGTMVRPERRDSPIKRHATDPSQTFGHSAGSADREPSVDFVEQRDGP